MDATGQGKSKGKGGGAAAEGAPKLIEHIHQTLDYTPFDVKWVPESARLVSLGVHPSGACVGVACALIH